MFPSGLLVAISGIEMHRWFWMWFLEEIHRQKAQAFWPRRFGPEKLGEV